ncbi:hypothetical protein BH10ACT9_BH10ACT9_55520 [soil metagenome]
MTELIPSGVNVNLDEHEVALSAPSTVVALTTTTDWLDYDVALTRVSGEIDATNSAELFEYVVSKVLLCRRLVFDLTRVKFLSCEGYSMLKTLERRCLMADVELEVLQCACVARTLHVCELADRRND